MSDAQLYFAAGLPSLVALVGILVNVGYFIVLNGRITRLEQRLDKRIDDLGTTLRDGLNSRIDDLRDGLNARIEDSKETLRAEIRAAAKQEAGPRR